MGEPRMVVVDDNEWRGGWYAARATCAVCGATWAAVYPECCTVIECTVCGHMTTAPHILDARDREADDGDSGDAWKSDNTMDD